MKTLLIEPFGGLAGDMLLAALIDLEQSRFGLPDLVDLAETLVPGEARLATSEVMRGAFRGLHLALETPETKHAPHRHLSDLLALLGRTSLSGPVRERSIAILTRIAEAEAEVHGTSVEAVHFHEVGAVDTLIDVVGACLALERLGIERVLSRPPFVGGGTITGAHGSMPVPAPGTAAILRGMPHELGLGGERLTPTGAAILAEVTDTWVEGQGLVFRGDAIGHGAGTRESKVGPANLVRIQLGHSPSPKSTDEVPTMGALTQVWLLEVNLDDTTPEEVGFLLCRLREAGALEAWSQAVQMKKDRPGVLISALARDEFRTALEKTCFQNTATLGLRWSPRQRVELARETLTVDLGAKLGLRSAPVRVVRRLWEGAEGVRAVDLTSLDLSPEFDDLAALANITKRPLRELEAMALAAARKTLP